MRKMTGMAYVYQWYATVNLETIRFTASSLLRCCKIWNQERIRMINNLMYIELKKVYPRPKQVKPKLTTEPVKKTL